MSLNKKKHTKQIFNKAKKRWMKTESGSVKQKLKDFLKHVKIFHVMCKYGHIDFFA